MHRNLILRHSSTKCKHIYASCTIGQANEHNLTCCRRPCHVSLQLSSCDIAVVLSNIQNLEDLDDTAPFSILGPGLLQMIFSYYGTFAWKARHSRQYSHAPELSRSRGQNRCNTRVGGWTQINIKEKNKVLLCASESVTSPIALTCCGPRKNVHAYLSVLNPWVWFYRCCR